MAREANSRDLPVSRREWLKFVAAGGSTTLLAGCTGGGSGDGTETAGGSGDGTQTSSGDETGTTGGGDETGPSTGGGAGTTGDQASVDRYFILPHIKNMEQAQFNLWNPTRNIGFERFFLFDEMTHFLPNSVEYDPVIATDWTRDDDTIVLNVREGLSWHSGQEFTADDIVNHVTLGNLTGFPVWDFIDSLEATDDHTVEYTLSSSNTNTSIAMHQIVTGNVYTHPELHSQFLDRLSDATSTDAEESLTTDLVQYEISPEDAKETVGSGPVMLTEATNRELTLDVYENYPFGLGEGGSTPNFNGMKSQALGQEGGVIFTAAANDKTDIFRSTPPSSVSFPDHWQRASFPTFGGQGIHFSPTSVFGEDTETSRAIRRAVGFWYNPNQWVQIYGPSASNVPSGSMTSNMVPPLDEQWLSEVQSDLTNYGNEEVGWQRADRANQTMTDAGFEKNNDGYWVHPDSGEVLEAPLQFPGGWADGVPGYRNMAEQLDEFGIRSEPSGQEVTGFLGDTLKNDDFQLAACGFGAGPHPYQSYRASMGSLSTTQWDYRNKLEEVTVPMPVGDPDGEMKTLNVNDRIKSLSTTTDEAKVQEIVTELAWIANQWVPLVEAENRLRELGLATDDWNWDVEWGSDLVKSDQPWAHLFRLGKLSAKQ